MAFLHLFCTWRPSCRMIGNGMSAFQSVFKNRLIPPKEIVQQLCVWPVLRWRVIYWTWYNPIISPTFLSVSLSLSSIHTHTRRHTGHGCFHVTTHQHCTDEWSGRWEEWAGRREKAMKGKDEESGLEKRQKREVGQRQATSVFGGMFLCIPVPNAGDVGWQRCC